MPAENVIKHLWDCALSLDAENHSKRLLKSYLINTCRRVAGKKETIPLERFASSQMCGRCSSHWSENEFQLKLKPQTVAIRTNKARRLINKLKEQQQKSKDQCLLTKKQKKRTKWLLKHSQSKVEIKCEFCQHKTFVTLNKPGKEKIQKTNALKDVETDEVPMEKAKVKKKKKKNKDSTAGLTIPKSKNKEIENSAKKLNRKLEEKTPPKKSETSTAPSQKTTILNTKSKNTKTKKSLKKEAPPKQQSKTQKENSLLKLAALLKSQEQNKKLGGSGNSTKSRLESFLN